MSRAADGLFYPPRGLCREDAARYIGVGTSKFDELVRDGRMPKPKRLDGRTVWDRVQLDMAFTDLPEDGKRNYFEGIRAPAIAAVK